jgi:hypothetical protein
MKKPTKAKNGTKPARQRPLHPEVRELLQDITSFCQRHGMTRTRFGLKVANDGHFIHRLEKGRMASLRVLDKARSFIHRRHSSRELR